MLVVKIGSDLILCSRKRVLAFIIDEHLILLVNIEVTQLKWVRHCSINAPSQLGTKV